jgi:hypothetical protein
MGEYLLNLLIMLDQGVNTIFGGYPDETISLRAALARDGGARWGCLMCKFLEMFAANHCTNVEQDERFSIRERHLE